MLKTIIVIPHNHFDPVWRRCFEHTATLGDINVASYSVIEKLCFDRWIDYKQTITEGQASILRKYLENSPKRKAQLQEMAQNGTFACPMAGETVQDTNLPIPEGLIRNFLVPMDFYNDLLGEYHSAFKLVWVEDAFGLSQNYPQILRGVGADTVCKICYKLPDGKVWEGIDGSRVAYLERFYYETALGTFEKHPPCEFCKGKGCEQCEFTGLKFIPSVGYEAICNTIENSLAVDSNYIVMYVGGEELLPEAELMQAINDMQKRHPEAKIRIGTILDVYNDKKTEIDECLLNDEGSTKELNPVFQGCYVSRIKLKQNIRRLSYMLCAVENSLANKAFKNADKIVYPDDLNNAWRLITFCHFHDTITGTLVDNAYDEVMGNLALAEEIIKRYLPNKKVHEEQTGKPLDTRVLTWGENTIEFDDFGIIKIITAEKDLFGIKQYGRLRRPFRIGELTLEPDYGDSWATRIVPYFNPIDNQSLIQLGDYQHISEITENQVVWEGSFMEPNAFEKPQGTDYLVKKLVWTITMSRGEKGSIDFKTDIDWDTYSKRIRVMFPVNSYDLDATYEIPFGSTKRTYEADKINYHEWSPNYMEFPAENWVLKTIDENSGVAFLNRGLPCWRWYPGCFELSVLRSPQAQFVGNEQRYFDFNDLDGLRDAGEHSLEYSVLPYTDRKTLTEISQIAFDYNMEYDFQLPFTVSVNIIVTAFKPAQDGKGTILRFYNAENISTDAVVNFGARVTITECNMLEKPEENKSFVSDRYSRNLRKFEIVTLRIEK